jgi:Thioredoxin-like proteins and domains
VELIGVTPEGGIKLRLEGNCNGCPSSRITLKSSIEEAIYAAAPDVTGLEVEGAVDNFVNAPDGLQPKFTVCPTDNEQETTTKRDHEQKSTARACVRNSKGEEQALKSREPGRDPNRKNYRSARDSTGINADKREPIVPGMGNIPPA